MKAIILAGFGGPEVMEIRDVPDPEPGAGEVVVRVVASGLNRADLMQREGHYPAPPGAPSDIPGLEFAGVVETCGPAVDTWREGDGVMGIVGGGGYAERLVTHGRTLVRIPEGMDGTTAAAIPEAFMTAYDAVFVQAGLTAGETVLIHAVGSGVGTAAVQLARRSGARTIGTSRTDAKLERAQELGLDFGVSGEDDWPERVLAATGGRGVDVILGLVGGAYLSGNMRVLATRGRYMVVGIPGGRAASLDLRTLMGRRGSITGTVLRARPLEEKIVLAREFERRVIPGFEDGSLLPIVDRTFTPEEVAEAHRRMEENRNFGKLLLVWD